MGSGPLQWRSPAASSPTIPGMDSARPLRPNDWRASHRYQRELAPDLRVLEDLEQRLAVLTALDAPMWVFDTERCQCLWANVAGLEIWRADSVHELQRRDVAGTQSDAIYALVNDYLHRVLGGERITEWVTLEVRGNTRRFMHTYHPFRLLDGRDVLLIEAKAAPTAEELLAFTSDYTLTVGLYELDGRLVSSNPAFRKLNEQHPLGHLDALLPAERAFTDWPQRLREQNQLLFETTLNTARGLAWFRGELRRVLAEDGRTQALLTLYDLTEQRLRDSERALQENRARTERLLDSAEVATVVMDLQSGEVRVDRRWWSMLGYDVPIEVLAPNTWRELLHPDDRALLEAEMERVRTRATNGWDLELRLRAKDGSWRWVLDRSVVTRRGERGEAVETGGIHLDIHARKEAEEQLRTSETRQRVLLGALPDLMCVVDLDGTLAEVHVNNPAEWGLGKGIKAGDNVRDLLSPSALQLFQRSQRHVLKTGQMVSGSYESDRPGRGIRYREMRTVPYGPARTLTLVRDITEQRRAELQHEQAVKQLQQAQKMDALGQLTGGIAHDFNNLLASMLGYSWLAAQHPLVANDAKLSEYHKAITAAGERGRDLVQKMLTFSRRGGTEPVAAVAPVPVVEDAFRMLRSLIPSRFELSFEQAGDIPQLAVDGTELQQVLVNLVVNSRDAMSDPGEIRVRLDCEDTSGHFCSSCQRGVEGRHVRLSVTDTGCGMTPDVQERMFDPFFTTKAVGAGTGIGLSTVDGIVHRYGGHLVVQSTPGLGTRIEVLLPVTPLPETGAEATAVIEEPVPAHPEARHLMVVDDQPWLAEFLAELLKADGYRVSAFAEPEAALAAFGADPTAYFAVITDLNLGSMDGLAFARTLHAQAPEVPVLLCTGDSQLPGADALKAAGIQRIIPKPLPIDEVKGLLGSLGRDRGSLA